MYFKCSNYEAGIWGVRFKEKWPYIKIKASWNAPLFSERYKSYIIRIPLGLGWRIIVSK